jgi:heme exporter protein C
MFLWFHKLGSPPHFYRIAGKWIPWLTWIFLAFLLTGLYGGLIEAPPDYQQGESYRIIFVHVPSAWMSLLIYVVMAFCGAIVIIWHMKLAEVVLISSAPIGASFTFLALITGSLWGKPMWGTYWVWDARLTSELILLFLYLGIIGLHNAIDDRRHYSVEWWHSLHQGPTVTKFDKPSIHWSMLLPLLLMAMAFQVYYVLALFQKCRVELLRRERNSKWVEEL